MSQDPSAMQLSDQSKSIGFANREMQDGGFSMAEFIECASKRFQDDLQLLGRIIKEHEDNLKALKTHIKLMEDSILDKQVSLARFQSSSQPVADDQNLFHCQSEEETTKQILQHEKSAAGLFCKLRTHYTSQPNDDETKDVLGIVATLGRVDNDNLSRLLSEYLGVETMLAVVCKTYEGVKALETHDSEGCIDRSSGLHGLGASIGWHLDGRFTVICLEYLRLYSGNFVADDPQRRLDLPKPRLPNGECPPGFLGFAVNLINLHATHLSYITASGCGLRETLFYNLFFHLQVFQTRAEMINALPCLSSGAISLDGGIIRRTGVYSLGSRKEDVDVRFGVGLPKPSLPTSYFEVENQIRMMKWKKDKLTDDTKREQALLDQAKVNFEIKKQEFLMKQPKSSDEASSSY